MRAILKDPAVLNYYAVVNLLCVVNLLSHNYLLRQPPLCSHNFPGFCRHFSPERGVHAVVNMGGVVKTLRRSNSLSRSVFSTAGSFGIAIASDLRFQSHCVHLSAPKSHNRNR